MQVHRHRSAREFLDTAREYLLRDESENHLTLGLAGDLAGAPLSGKLLLTVAEADTTLACAVEDFPGSLILNRTDDAPLTALADQLVEWDVDLAKASGPVDTVQRFAELVVRRTGKSVEDGMRQSIHRLEQVTPSSRSCPGHLRPARAGEVDHVAAWIKTFFDEVEMPVGDTLRMAREKIDRGAVYLWEDGVPVTMAGWAGPTPNGVRVNLVYTPPELRGRGYASACVEALSRRLLEGERRWCFLYTDLANPTSNRLYQRIGYRPVCDIHQLLFS